MRKFTVFSFYFLLCFFLSSCTMRCSVGDVGDEPKGDAKVVNGVRVFNDIALETSGVKVEKAYLILENGDPVSNDNVITFDQPVKVKLYVSEGWKENNGKVNLGVEEIITAPTGEVLLHENDLFEKYPGGITKQDAKLITVSAKIIIKRQMEPHSTFGVMFRVWDKNDSNNFIKGSYKLYSK